MNLQEPKVEFVPIDQNQFIQAASCPDGADQVYGGGQVCRGSQPEAKDCATWDDSIPYSSGNDN